MEIWGVAALAVGEVNQAEEAFLEALAHDPAAARAALGLQVLCEHQVRNDEAARYAELARRLWEHADAGVIDHELQFFRAFTLRDPFLSEK
jgi:Tfp pilus assembly protein PilF